MGVLRYKRLILGSQLMTKKQSILRGSLFWRDQVRLPTGCEYSHASAIGPKCYNLKGVWYLNPKLLGT